MLGLTLVAVKNEGWSVGQLSKENDLVVWDWGNWDAPYYWLRSYGGEGRNNGNNLASKFDDADYNTGPGLFFPGISRETFILYNYSGIYFFFFFK